MMLQLQTWEDVELMLQVGAFYTRAIVLLAQHAQDWLYTPLVVMLMQEQAVWFSKTESGVKVALTALSVQAQFLDVALVEGQAQVAFKRLAAHVLAGNWVRVCSLMQHMQTRLLFESL